MTHSQNIQHAIRLPPEDKSATKHAIASPGKSAPASESHKNAALPHQPIEIEADFFNRPLPSVVSQKPAAAVPLAPVPEKAWEGSLSGHLRHFNQRSNYDRVVNVIAYGQALKEQGLLNTPETRRQMSSRYAADSAQWIKSEKGGNCVGLSGQLLGALRKEGGWEACLVGSSLKDGFSFPSGPKIGHVAVMLSVDVGTRKKQVLLEPGFNFTDPIALPDVGEAPLQLPYGTDKVWVVSRQHPLEHGLQPDMSKIYCHIEKKERGRNLKAKEIATYYLKAFDEPDSVTRGIAGLDTRPVILGRNSEGDIIAKVAIDYKKRKVSLSLGKVSESLDMPQIQKAIFGHLPLENVDLTELAKALKTSPQALGEKIHAAVNLADTLHPKAPTS